MACILGEGKGRASESKVRGRGIAFDVEGLGVGKVEMGAMSVRRSLGRRVRVGKVRERGEVVEAQLVSKG